MPLLNVRATCTLASRAPPLGMYGGAGMVLFGQQMGEFATFDNAVRNTATLFTTGESDIYHQQVAVNKVGAELWQWTLVLIMFFVLTNMMLGILVEAYDSAVKELQQDAETVEIT